MTVRRSMTVSSARLVAGTLASFVTDASSEDWKQAYATVLVEAGLTVPAWLASHKPKGDVWHLIGWIGSESQAKAAVDAFGREGKSLAAYVGPILNHGTLTQSGKAFSKRSVGAVTGSGSPKRRKVSNPSSPPAAKAVAADDIWVRVEAYAARLGIAGPYSPGTLQALRVAMEDAESS